VIGGVHHHDSGHRLVHTAPGHGVMIFKHRQKVHLPVLCPVGFRGHPHGGSAGRSPGSERAQRLQTAPISPPRNEAGALLKQESLRPPLPLRLAHKKPEPSSRHREWFCHRWRASAPRRWPRSASVGVAADSGRTGIEAIGCAIGATGASSGQRNLGVPIPVFYPVTTGGACSNARQP